MVQRGPGVLWGTGAWGWAQPAGRGSEESLPDVTSREQRFQPTPGPGAAMPATHHQALRPSQGVAAPLHPPQPRSRAHSMCQAQFGQNKPLQRTTPLQKQGVRHSVLLSFQSPLKPGQNGRSLHSTEFTFILEPIVYLRSHLCVPVARLCVYMCTHRCKLCTCGVALCVYMGIHGCIYVCLYVHVYTWVCTCGMALYVCMCTYGCECVCLWCGCVCVHVYARV